ncbi:MULTISPECIES: CBS domain-containing protein [Acidithrix]|uniref:Magnesium transporter MgtE n=2 Tax=root TaxID=1 RepID=A0A0D8HGZ1_9ACTN|nr:MULTISPECIES: CBS domain-containing protein [Acidithrix]KJF17042.1 magnesium transporter MgtE [Acidithrix ferrooxidans]CAG4919001.1 unnamed protein product [Acidithrix sp. C25]
MAYKVQIPSPVRISRIRVSRARRILAISEIRAAIMPLSGLLGITVRNQSGGDIGVLVDIVARWSPEIDYPPITGLIVRVGRQRTFVDIDKVEIFETKSIALRSSKVDLRDFSKRNNEVLLMEEILDHQLVDVEGIQVIRASELYLANALGKLRLVGVEVGVNALFRRMAPQRIRARANPIRVIDWSDVAAFDETSGEMKLRAARANGGIKRLRPAELADLLEDLGRRERSGLIEALGVEAIADALEEMDAEQIESFIRNTEPDIAADLVANMEPDEAVDVLRDLDEDERDELLDLLEPDVAADLKELISYDEKTAGGIMTSLVLEVHEAATISEVIDQLRDLSDHGGDLDGVVVFDEDGNFCADVSIFELLMVSNRNDQIATLVRESKCVTVDPNDDLDAIAEALIETRRSSVVVVEEGKTLGRILADDLVDAILPDRSKGRFPRLLS